MKNLNDILKKCKKGNRRAQYKLVGFYGPRLLPICKRYTSDSSTAQDALQETFINIFKYLDQWQGLGSFEGWIRKIAVNASLNTQKKTFKRHYLEVSSETEFMLPSIDPTVYSDMGIDDLTELIKTIPEHYAIVFNLYVVEGYTHKEIGVMLGITESTSRSSLSRARKMIVEKLREGNYTSRQKKAI